MRVRVSSRGKSGSKPSFFKNREADFPTQSQPSHDSARQLHVDSPPHGWPADIFEDEALGELLKTESQGVKSLHNHTGGSRAAPTEA